MVQLLHACCFEGHRPDQHGIQADTRRPYIHFEPLIAFVLEDLWGDISGRPTLLGHALLVSLNLAGDAKVSNLDPTVGIKEDIIKLDISVYD